MYDTVAHQSTIISCIQRARFSLCGGMDIPARLKALRNRTEPRLSSRATAAALDMPDSTYAAYEDPKKFKQPILPMGLAKKLAALFEQRGIPANETLELAGVTGELTEAMRAYSEPRPVNEWVEVTGSVAAGVWREQSEWPVAERYEVRFGPPPFSTSQRFGLRMEGLSMNRTIPPGSDLECLRVAFSSASIEPGALVIVERNAHDLTEMTCKRLDKVNDEWVLRCESFEPEFQDVIPIGHPDGGMFTDDEIRVVAIVLSSKQDHAPRGLGARRYRS